MFSLTQIPTKPNSSEGGWVIYSYFHEILLITSLVSLSRLVTSGWILWASAQHQQRGLWEDARSILPRTPLSVSPSHDCNMFHPLIFLSLEKNAFNMNWSRPISFSCAPRCLKPWPSCCCCCSSLAGADNLPKCKHMTQNTTSVYNILFLISAAHRSALHRHSQPPLPSPWQSLSLAAGLILLILNLLGCSAVKQLSGASLELVPIIPAHFFGILTCHVVFLVTWTKGNNF